MHDEFGVLMRSKYFWYTSPRKLVFPHDVLWTCKNTENLKTDYWLAGSYKQAWECKSNTKEK